MNLYCFTDFWRTQRSEVSSGHSVTRLWTSWRPVLCCGRTWCEWWARWRKSWPAWTARRSWSLCCRSLVSGISSTTSGRSSSTWVHAFSYLPCRFEIIVWPFWFIKCSFSVHRLGKYSLRTVYECSYYNSSKDFELGMQCIKTLSFVNTRTNCLRDY